MTDVMIYDMDEILSIKQAAKELRISTRTIYRWMDRGKIKALPYDEKVLFSREEIERLKCESRTGTIGE